MTGCVEQGQHQLDRVDKERKAGTGFGKGLKRVQDCKQRKAQTTTPRRRGNEDTGALQNTTSELKHSPLRPPHPPSPSAVHHLVMVPTSSLPMSRLP